MKKFFKVCKGVAMFAAGAIVAAGLEYGFCVEIVLGLVLAVAVYGLATASAQRASEEERVEE